MDNIIENPKINRNLLLNWAIFFGKICAVYSQYVVKYLNKFLKPFSVGFTRSKLEDEAKGQAFIGILEACMLYAQQ